jgi:uncharacterized coiled-coil DUF342 family protein
MNEYLVTGLIGLVGVFIGALPQIVGIFNGKKKADADTASVLTKVALELVDPLAERIKTLETETQKKIEEAACLTVERDELKEQVDELRKEVEALRVEVDELRAENKSLKAALDKRRKPVEKKV